MKLSFFFQESCSTDKFLQNNFGDFLKQACKVTFQNTRKEVLCNYLMSHGLETTFPKREELSG